MANGSGIDLLRRCLKRTKDFKPIIISGYSEVDYLRNAIQLQAVDYLFKPIDVDELLRSSGSPSRCWPTARTQRGNEAPVRLPSGLHAPDSASAIWKPAGHRHTAGPELDERISTLGLPEWLSEGASSFAYCWAPAGRGRPRATCCGTWRTAGLERVLSACLAEADAQVL
jgi:CheY-like chemotaxis protein